MVEPDRDPRVLQAYRRLGAEEPPAALDAAILAAARRRGGRWAAPVAAAATLVLAVGVAVVVQREEPRTREEVALAPQVIPAPEPVERQASADSGRRLERSAREAVAARSGPAPAAPADAARPEPKQLAEQAPASEVAGMAAKPAEDAVASQARALAKSSAEARESPEQWLKRIAALRDAGRQAEADDSLAEFRKRYPDYRIPEEMRARVLRR